MVKPNYGVEQIKTLEGIETGGVDGARTRNPRIDSPVR